MKRILASLALLAVAATSSPARAADDEDDEPRAEVMLDTVFGLTGDQAHDGGRQVDAIVRSFLLEGRLEIAHDLDLKLYVPFSHASVRINGDSNTRSAFGNVGLAVEHEFDTGKHQGITLGLLLGLPTAQGDSLSTDRTAREKASLGELSGQIRSFEEDEFFIAHRFSIVPRIDYSALAAGWELSVYAKVPVLVRAGGEDAPVGTVKVAGAAVEVVGAAQAMRVFGELEATRGLAAAIGPRVVAVGIAVEPIDDTALAARKRLQLAFEWAAKLRFGPVLMNLGVLVPVIGRANESYPRQHAYRIAVGANF